MSEKRTRISLAQKLDIIEASKKSGFSIEDVMKKYGLKKSTVYRLLAEKEKYTQQEVNTHGFEPAQIKPALNLSQLLDEEPEDINELDKCFYEPASFIRTPGKRKRI